MYKQYKDNQQRTTHNSDSLTCHMIKPVLHKHPSSYVDHIQNYKSNGVTNIRQKNKYFIIFQACKEGLLQHLEHLLFYGADMDVQNAGGNTAIHICAINNQVQILKKHVTY